MSVAQLTLYVADMVHFLHRLKCAARFVWYWFRFPTGWYVSGHEYEERADGRLVCRDCGRVSE